MTLRSRLVLRWSLAAALPLALHLGLYRGASLRTEGMNRELDAMRGEVAQKTGQFSEASRRILEARPPAPPTPTERLDAALSINIHGMVPEMLSREEGSVRLALRGDTLAIVDWIEALQGLAAPPRVRSLSIAPEGPATDGKLRLGTLVLEAEP